MTGPLHEGLLRPHLKDLPPYQTILPFEVLSEKLGRSPADIVKLDANENPYGPLPAARAALAAHPFLHIYPDPEQRAVRAAIADYVGVNPEEVLVGHGADELIDLICRLFLGPGDRMIDCPPTFGMYRFDAGLAGATVVEVPRLADFNVDLPGIVSAMESTCSPKLIFLAAPNNPDGGCLAEGVLERLLAMPLIVVVDEAYVEFAGLDRSVAGWVAQHQNLVVLRTFSKWAGLAGLRLGYGILPRWLMEVALRAKQPYNVSVAAAAAGLASLLGREQIRPSIEAIIRERERLIEELAAFEFLSPLPSRANFVLCRVIGRSAAGLQRALAAEGVLVRHYATARLANYIRISAGRPGDTDVLMEALSRIRGAAGQGSVMEGAENAYRKNS